MRVEEVIVKRGEEMTGDTMTGNERRAGDRIGENKREKGSEGR
jgi:hypothetical protein